MPKYGNFLEPAANCDSIRGEPESGLILLEKTGCIHATAMLNTYTDSELLSQTRFLVAEERRLTSRVLLHLEEIERRSLHLKSGFGSLFEFCLRELGYSESEAHCRISAMRLAREVPHVVEAVESGKLSLTNLARAQTFFRQEKKSGRPVAVAAKQELLRELEGLSTRACERKLSEMNPERKRTVSFEVDEETLGALQRIRELWGNQNLPDAELFKKMTKLVLSKIDPGLKQSVRAPQVETVKEEEGPPADMITPESRYIPEPVKREVWRRDGGRCTFHSGTHRCESRYALQWDHIILYAHGGAHTVDNLRLLCRSHHALRSKLIA